MSVKISIFLSKILIVWGFWRSSLSYQEVTVMVTRLCTRPNRGWNKDYCVNFGLRIREVQKGSNSCCQFQPFGVVMSKPRNPLGLHTAASFLDAYITDVLIQCLLVELSRLKGGTLDTDIHFLLHREPQLGTYIPKCECTEIYKLSYFI